LTWFAAFRCLECEHFWREPSPEDAWEMATQVAAAAVCPLCGAQMREGRVELLSHVELNPALLDSISYIFPPADNSSPRKTKGR
jgi:hypothetical protein